LNKILNNHFRRVKVKEREAFSLIVILFFLSFVLLLCWTLIDPLKWQREPINESDPTSTYGFCQSEGKASPVFAGLLIFVDVLALVLACAQAYRSRNMIDELTESRWLGVACASWIQVLVIGVPVVLLTREDPIASYFTQTALVFLICASMLLLIFLPKVWAIKATMLMSLESFDRRITFSIVPSQQSATQATYLHMETEYKRRIRELEQRLQEASAANSLSAKPEHTLGETVSMRVPEMENLSSRVLELDPAIGEATSEVEHLSASLAKEIKATE